MSSEYSDRESNNSQEDDGQRDDVHAMDAQSCLLCGSSGPTGIRNASVHQLRHRVNRARQLVLLIHNQPRVPADGKLDDDVVSRLERERILEEELAEAREKDRIQHDEEIEKLREKRMSDVEMWESLKSQLDERVLRQNEELHSIKAELGDTRRLLEGAERTLRLPENSVRNELFQRKAELQNRKRKTARCHSDCMERR